MRRINSLIQLLRSKEGVGKAPTSNTVDYDLYLRHSLETRRKQIAGHLSKAIEEGNSPVLCSTLCPHYFISWLGLSGLTTDFLTDLFAIDCVIGCPVK